MIPSLPNHFSKWEKYGSILWHIINSLCSSRNIYKRCHEITYLWPTQGGKVSSTMPTVFNFSCNWPVHMAKMKMKYTSTSQLKRKVLRVSVVCASSLFTNIFFCYSPLLIICYVIQENWISSEMLLFLYSPLCNESFLI